MHGMRVCYNYECDYNRSNTGKIARAVCCFLESIILRTSLFSVIGEALCSWNSKHALDDQVQIEGITEQQCYLSETFGI
jgi:hypothetical protein